MIKATRIGTGRAVADGAFKGAVLVVDENHVVVAHGNGELVAGEGKGAGMRWRV